MIISSKRPHKLRGRETWIGELLQCRCRHGVGHHWETGCEGDYRGSCRCRMTRDAVLQAAIARERYP